MTAKIAVIYYSTYGHVTKLTESVIEGAKSTGAQVDIYQIPETLSDDILAKQHAIPRPDHPKITGDLMEQYDGFIFGFPTRYGRAPGQVSQFFDSTGKQWASGALIGKFATVFTSAASQHGGLESTALTTVPFFAHHGIAFVSPGYAANKELTALDEIVGGSAYGAGTIAGGDGSRQPTANDLAVAKHQGSFFAGLVGTFVAGKAKLAGHSSNNTVTAAQALPASAAVASQSGARDVNTNDQGYSVDQPQKDNTTAATPVAAPAPAAVGTTTQQPATTTAAPAAQQQQPAAKKSSIFARCCGSSKDYA